MSTKIGFEIYLDASYDQTVSMVTESLKSAGFGVLTSITDAVAKEARVRLERIAEQLQST